MSATPDSPLAAPPDDPGLYHALFHANPQPMWIYDVETLEFLDVNAAAIEHYGFTRDEFLSMTLAGIRPPGEVDAMHGAVKAARDLKRVSTSGPWHHQTKDGRPLRVRSSSHGLQFQGRDARLVLTTDVSQQLAMEAERERMITELQRSRERLDAAIDGGNVGLWERDLLRHTLSCGGRWAEILGTTPEAFGEITPQRFMDLCHPDDYPTSLERLYAHLRNPDEPYADEFRMRHASGRWIWVLSRGKVADRTPEGRSARMVGTFVDVSDVKAAQAAGEQQRAAEQANAMKSQFLARVSHELRTPLNAVLGFSQLLRLDTRSPLSPDQHERVVYIEQAGQHLLALITDLMDLSKIEVDAVPMEQARIDLPSLVDECLLMVDAQVTERGLRVGRAYASGCPAVIADTRRLRQCVLNLLSNAIKYNVPATSTTQGQLRVGVEDSGDGNVLFSVWNTGPGLTAEQLQRLYEPFNRLGRDAGPEQGTGIGLAITRQLVERMGGRIEALSEPGVWMLFTLTLPKVR